MCCAVPCVSVRMWATPVDRKWTAKVRILFSVGVVRRRRSPRRTIVDPRLSSFGCAKNGGSTVSGWPCAIRRRKCVFDLLHVWAADTKQTQCTHTQLLTTESNMVNELLPLSILPRRARIKFRWPHTKTIPQNVYDFEMKRNDALAWEWTTRCFSLANVCVCVWSVAFVRFFFVPKASRPFEMRQN